MIGSVLREALGLATDDREMGIAFVVPRETGSDALAGTLSDFLAGRLARYTLPREFRFVDALPRTAYGKAVKGKVVKGELRQMVLEGYSLRP